VKAIVIGAGAWGLPAAAQLSGRGHSVTLVDRFGVQNPMSSSIGPTRLWRLADPDSARVRLSVRAVEAMRRLQSRCGVTVFEQRGLLWRDGQSIPALTEALDACGIEYTEVNPEDVGRWWPGLRPDGRGAVWQPDAGIVLAAASLQAQLRLFEKAGGATLFGQSVSGVATTSGGVRVSLDDGAVLAADVVVVAAGPGAAALNPALGLVVPLHPYLEQVVHFGDPARRDAYDDFPCLFDGPTDAQSGIYAMPTPGVGYKVGLDGPLRDYREDDLDRTPDAERTEIIRRRVAADLSAVAPTVLDAQVCSWTDSPDGRFVIDVLGGAVVVACGDSGEGFKFSALMGEVLADLAEGATPDDDIAALSAARFVNGVPERSGPHVLGRH
jgi:glycine/D-amino acid oxidase-like deaminating enzyme